MHLFRNSDFKKGFCLFLLLGMVATVGALFLGLPTAIFTLCLSLLFLAIFVWSSKKRYQKIIALTEDLNRILHGEENIVFSGYEEGELSILQSEILKMTLRLKEQSEQLVKDKIFLADSLADISHQLRTPLTTANLLVSRLSEPNLSRENAASLTRELYSLLSRMDWLIGALLKLSRLDSGTVELKSNTISLKALLEKAIEPIRVPLELRGQELHLEAEGDFCGDLLWTQEALTNILKNCMEHTGEGGQIFVSASENAIYAEIKIRDTGSGIAPEDLNHIFERFYKGKNSSKESFGIGLALSKSIITAQNGTVKVQNAKGGGAEFILKFYK